MVNFEGLRRGWEGDVELAPRIEGLIRVGYLKLLGHVDVPPVVSVAPPAPVVPAIPAPAPKPVRTKRAATTTPPDGGGTDGSGPGDPADQ